MGSFVTVAVFVILHTISNFNRESVINAQLIFREEVELVENSECKSDDNLWDVCTRASLCPQIKLNISKTKICSFDSSEAIIYCVRSSQLACHGYRIDHGELFQKPKQHFFVGGQRAKPREYPYMAAIGWTQDTSVSWKCGGSLISEDFLLTAAHCTNARGDINLPSICLWPNQELPTTELVGMGFGTTSFAGPQSNELFVGSLQNVPQPQCNAAYESNRDRRFSNGIIESQMCAKDPEGLKDTCQGDSGGPLQFVDYLTLRTYQVGITSFGEACAGPSPGVYTKVQAYVSWVEMIVWPEFSK